MDAPVPTAVTGAAGHLGVALCHALVAAGHPVRALVRGASPAVDALNLLAAAHPGRLTLVRGDVLDPASLRPLLADAGLVFHAAAQIALHHDPRAAGVNIDGAAHVAAACRGAGARLIHVSSTHALCQHPLDRPVDEDSRLWTDADREALPYERQKAEAERRVLAEVAAGLDAVIVNPATIVGPYDYRVSQFGRVFRLLHRGQLPAVVDGSQHFVDVRDVADGALRAARRGVRGRRYLLSGPRRSLREVVERYRAIAGVPSPRLTAPLWLCRPFAPLFEHGARLFGREPLFSSGALQALCGNPDVRWQRAADELGYQPRPIDDTLRDVHRWLLDANQVPAAPPRAWPWLRAAPLANEAPG